MNAQR
jgi:Ca2+-binding EF-hand superfamily protein